MISNPIYGKIKNVPNHQPVSINLPYDWIRHGNEFPIDFPPVPLDFSLELAKRHGIVRGIVQLHLPGPQRQQVTAEPTTSMGKNGEKYSSY